jgi:hypothetical protein
LTEKKVGNIPCIIIGYVFPRVKMVPESVVFKRGASATSTIKLAPAEPNLHVLKVISEDPAIEVNSVPGELTYELAFHADKWHDPPGIVELFVYTDNQFARRIGVPLTIQ